MTGPSAGSRSGRALEWPRLYSFNDGQSPTIAAIEQALSTVMEPELHRDIVSLHMVKDIRCEAAQCRSRSS